MDWQQIVQMSIGSGGLLGMILIFFRTGKIVEKIDQIEKRMITVEGKVDQQGCRLSKLEGSFEERGRKC